eukprot:scaffold45568_cov60-Phaeocystis_antarctica.AAC.2
MSGRCAEESVPLSISSVTTSFAPNDTAPHLGVELWCHLLRANDTNASRGCFDSARFPSWHASWVASRLHASHFPLETHLHSHLPHLSDDDDAALPLRLRNAARGVLRGMLVSTTVFGLRAAQNAYSQKARRGVKKVPMDVAPLARFGRECLLHTSLWSSVVVVTKIAAKVVAKKAAKQAAAEQAEVKAKKAIADADKATEEEATKELAEQMMPAEEATPAKANKE